ncbi:MAG: hypothetical protein GXP31_14465 [Kiritimatiellaeota bacterium]|nr:hypothetical protein [Kiritimatiellota bacterium]
MKERPVVSKHRAGRQRRRIAAALLTAAALLLGPAVASVRAAPRVRAGALELRFVPPDRIAAGVSSDPSLIDRVRLRLELGPKHVPLALGDIHAEKTLPGFTVFGRIAEPLMDVAVAFTPRGESLLWTVKLRNRAPKVVRLELGPEVVFGRTTRPTVFDGFNEDAVAPKTPALMHNFRMMTPYAAAWTPHGSVGTAISPLELPSWLQHAYRPGPPATLTTTTRIVLASGEERSVRFVTVGARGDWGKYEIMQAYFDAYPKCFLPFPGVDERVWLGGAEYRAFPVREWSPEICRRLGAGWEWCYAPFRRTGDIVGRPEFWDYTPVRPFSKRRALPIDAFHAWRKKAFRDGDRKCNVMMAFYVPAQIWCEERLAHQRYADALTLDPDSRIRFDTPWVTGNDNEVRVFPFRTSWGRQSRKDMGEVAHRLNLRGFAFDTADGVARYRGPALANLPNKYLAWDKDGVFCNESVAVAKLMDFVHTLRTSDGKPLAVIGNIGTGVYTSDIHCDAAMFEGEPWKLFRTYPDRLRWKLGRKAAVWWEGYGIERFIRDGNDPTQKQIAAIMRGLADFTLLQSLRLGYIPPPNYTQGVARLARWLPRIIDCIRRGWQPVPGVRVPEPLWAARYGVGLDTVLVVAHETGQPVKADLRIENSRFGVDGRLMVADARGRPLRNAFPSDTNTTMISANVPVRTPRLFEAVAELLPADRGPFPLKQGEVAVTQGVARRLVRILMQPRRAGREVVLRLGRPRGMHLVAATLDGRTLGVDAEARFSFRLTAPAALVAEFASDTFQGTDAALFDFPFVRDGKPACTIFVPEKVGPRVRRSAFRIQEYWRYWYGRALKPGHDVRIPIRTGDPTPAGDAAAVVLRLDAAMPTSGAVAIQGNRLLVRAPNELMLERTVSHLLAALDHRFFFPDRILGSALNNKVGLAGKVLTPAGAADSASELAEFPLLP